MRKMSVHFSNEVSRSNSKIGSDKMIKLKKTESIGSPSRFSKKISSFGKIVSKMERKESDSSNSSSD